MKVLITIFQHTITQSFVSLAFHHLTKLLFIQNKENRAPAMDDYDHLNYAKNI